MRFFTCGALLVGAMLLQYGCTAGIKAYEIDSAAPNAQSVPGLRYFLPAPYLVIRELPGGRWDARINLAVDRSREFTVQPYACLAKSTTEVNFNPDGTLKSFKLDQDTSAVPDALVNALKEIGLAQLEIEKENDARNQAVRGKPDDEKQRNLTMRGKRLIAAVFPIRGPKVGTPGAVSCAFPCASKKDSKPKTKPGTAPEKLP